MNRFLFLFVQLQLAFIFVVILYSYMKYHYKGCCSEEPRRYSPIAKSIEVFGWHSQGRLHKKRAGVMIHPKGTQDTISILSKRRQVH